MRICCTLFDIARSLYPLLNTRRETEPEGSEPRAFDGTEAEATMRSRRACESHAEESMNSIFTAKCTKPKQQEYMKPKQSSDHILRVYEAEATRTSSRSRRAHEAQGNTLPILREPRSQMRCPAFVSAALR